jgi:23S rRNA (pseudouridine1915-N3)-methyltransferase
LSCRITIAAVGKIREKYLQDGINEYSKRLSRFCSLCIVEAEDEQVPEGLSPALVLQAKKKEAEKLLKRLKSESTLIALDIKGQKLGSEEFAEKLGSLFISGESRITFIIGGSHGIDDELLRKANFRLSLSDFTFPHQLARLVLLEQLYRAFKIINGEVYHK